MRAISFALLTSALFALAAGCASPCADLDRECEKCGGQDLIDCKYCVTYYSEQACEKFLRDSSGCPKSVLLGCDQLGSGE